VDDPRVLIAWPMIRAFRRADAAFSNRKTADAHPDVADPSGYP
jgi:hypothetical protein